MLEVTADGQARSEKLWHQPQKDEEEMAFLAAVDTIDEFPVSDAYALANQLPFVHGLERKARTVRDWIAKGWISEKGSRF